jgi:protein Jumonji
VTVPKSPEEKRPIFQRRHEKLMQAKKSDAFSPENESSVYAFQMDPEDEPTGIPFRRKNKEDSNSTTPPTPPATHSVACSTESPPTKVVKPSTTVSATSTTMLPPFVSRNVSSNSIAVQVNFDEVTSPSSEAPSEPLASSTTPANVAPRNSFECSTQTEDETEDDHLFYIPLQTGTPTPQQLIQGVEVKLGTEGPNGPNQRVIMRAKLVTKPPERFSAALNATGMVR